MYNERQQKILELLKVNGEVQLNNLERTFKKVSLMTLRRDLILFERDGLLIRTKGGGISVNKIKNEGEETLYSFRELKNIEEKKIIANKAVNLIEKGRSLYFDSGTTLMCLAKIINDDAYTITTSGINITLELLKKEKPSVVSLGGHVNRNTISASGPNAMSLLDNMNIDIAFISASGFSLKNGFSVSNIYECELKRKIIEKSKYSHVLMDTSKLDKDLAFTFAKGIDITSIITECKLPKEYINYFSDNNVDIL